MVVLWFFHWCRRIALRKLALAEFLAEAWLRITIPHMLHLPFKWAHLPLDVVDDDPSHSVACNCAVLMYVNDFVLVYVYG